MKPNQPKYDSPAKPCWAGSAYGANCGKNLIAMTTNAVDARYVWMPYQATAMRPRIHRRNVRTEHAEGGAAHHRIRHAVDLAGLGDEVAKHVDDADADDERDEHLPTRQAQREQAAGEDVAAEAVHVRHPKREDIVGVPVLIFERNEIFVGQPRTISGGQSRLVVRVTRLECTPSQVTRSAVPCFLPKKRGSVRAALRAESPSCFHARLRPVFRPRG
jgi:hypothetical protein